MSAESTEVINSHTAAERVSAMDLDLDLDGPWQFDQIFFANPTSMLPSSDRPRSPPVDFSDGRDDIQAGNSTSMDTGSTRLFYNFGEVSCDPDSVTGSLPRIGSQRRLLPAPLGLTPLNNADWSFVIKERMAQALRYFKESTEQHVLAQVWAPVRKGDRYVLTTSGQPFVLDPRTNGLHQYRMVSLMYMFNLDGEDGGAFGLPGRVFQKKLPEWTPNVQYYTTKEYPRLTHALVYNVQGTLALPVFEPSGESCVGVIELIMTSPKINYSPEVDKICKALEAVNLRSSEILDHPTIQICNEGRQKALAEILEILTVVCETHKLPLAQTWVPCRHRSVLAIDGGLKKSCSSFDGSCMGQICMSTTDVAVYVVDAHMWGFREACTEHHLQKGQGVAGRAFASQNSCFCEDITQFSKTEYPLVHYARMFGLTGAFAICLRSTHTRNDDFILEFFLPPDIGDRRDQLKLLGSILVTVKQHQKSLKVASVKEHDGKGGCVEIIKAVTGESSEIESVQVLQSAIFPPGPVPLQNGPEMEHLDSPRQQLREEVDSITRGGSIGGAGETQNGDAFPVCRDMSKKSERKRGKAEKSISIEVLQQYFAGSLKDAAKSLGVCRTTMKRICRQHGISRWPSRKINKVSRSLSKLQRVMESVPGAGGQFKLASLATSFLPVTASSNVPNGQNAAGSKPSNLGEEKQESMTPDDSGSEHHEGLSPSKSGSGLREESCGTPTSDGSSHGVPCLGNQHSSQNDLAVSPLHEKYMEVELMCQPAKESSLSAAFSTPDAHVATQNREKFRGTPIGDAESPHDLSPAAVEVPFDDQVPLCSQLECREGIIASTDRMPHVLAGPEVETVTIKAMYNDDIIRFRLSLDSDFAKLNEEVSKRLKVGMGTFDIKYLDDDTELVLMSCDADLLECVDVSKSSGSKIIRLSVHDVMPNQESSCESSGLKEVYL